MIINESVSSLPRLPESLREAVSIRQRSDLALSDFHIHKNIGSGSLSSVKLVTLVQSLSKTPFALKLVSKSEVVRCRHLAHLQEERSLVGRLDFPFVVTFVRSFQTDAAVGLLFEFVNGGDLFSLLSAEEALSESWARFYLAEILCVLRHLHSQRIVYRDLKPENVLLSTSGHVKVSDFGLAKDLSHARATTLCGTPEYMAPELLVEGNRGHSFGVDYWALGILAYELVTG
jgi:protein kinase A/protein kinase X